MGVFVALLWTAFFSLLAKVLPYLVSRVLLTLGIGFATISGVQYGFDQLILLLKTYLGQLPFVVASLLKIAGFDVGLSFVLSALAFNLSLRLVSGSLNFFRFKSSHFWA